jgi:hypothetical protein
MLVDTEAADLWFKGLARDSWLPDGRLRSFPRSLRRLRERLQLHQQPRQWSRDFDLDHPTARTNCSN